MAFGLFRKRLAEPAAPFEEDTELLQLLEQHTIRYWHTHWD